jgi:hypothetical protein
MTEMAPYLTLNVPPDEMVKYIQDLMTLPHSEIAAGSAMALAQRHWGGDTPLARAALLRWSALNLAFQDKRLETWTTIASKCLLHWSRRRESHPWCWTTSGRFSTSPRFWMRRWIFSRQRVRPKPS